MSMFHQKSVKYTPHNSIENDENVNPLNRFSQNRTICCMNHPTKKAKYCMPKDLSVSLCSKCAVSMVGKGFKVEELDECEDEQRRELINRFLYQVNKNIPQYEKVLSGLITKKQDITKYFEQQIDKVIRFHTTITQQINNEKDTLINTLTQNFKSTTLLYEEKILQVQNAQKESIGMQKDVEQNLERIIKHIANEPFQEIIACYNKTIENYEEELEELKRKPLDVFKITINEIIDLSQLISIGIQKTSMVKKSVQEIGLRTITNEDICESMVKRDSYISKQNSKNALSSLSRTPKTESSPYKQVPITHINLFQTPEQQSQKLSKIMETIQQHQNKQQQQQSIFQPQLQRFSQQPIIEQLQKLKSIPQDQESHYEEGHSQMIEREDIENSYQMMIADSVSDSEDLIDQLNLIQSLTIGQNSNINSLKMFSSPQFKNK